MNSWDKSTIDFIAVLMPLYITYNLLSYHIQNIHESPLSRETYSLIALQFESQLHKPHDLDRH